MILLDFRQALIESLRPTYSDTCDSWILHLPYNGDTIAVNCTLWYYQATTVNVRYQFPLITLGTLEVNLLDPSSIDVIETEISSFLKLKDCEGFLAHSLRNYREYYNPTNKCWQFKKRIIWTDWRTFFGKSTRNIQIYLAKLVDQLDRAKNDQ